jgi:hypothetical protein
VVVAAAAAVLLPAASASAAQTLYTTRAAFDAAAGNGLALESFETQRNGQTVSYPPVSVSETGDSFNLIVHTSNNATFTKATTLGSHSIWFIDGTGGSRATFTFATPITAFGLDTAFSQARTATFSGGVSGSLALAANTASFFGVISDTPFTSVVVEVSGSGVNVGFDALAYGTAATAGVPEPGTWALMIAGFGLLGAAMRSHKAVRVGAATA